MDRDGKSTDAYTYHSIACLPINFRTDQIVQNTPPIVETEVLYHPLDGLLIPITNYVAQERLTERIRERKKEYDEDEVEGQNVRERGKKKRRNGMVVV